MDPASTLAALTSIIAIVPKAIDILASAGFKYRNARFGPVWGTILYASRLVDTDALQQQHWHINSWSDEEVSSWKASHLASCNAIAVAAAIFASIGLTALQLPDMDSTHWSARACCVVSMILGVVSVTTATRQVHTIGMLKSPMEVRLWLSRGKPTSYRDGSRTTFDQETNLTDEDDDVERLASVGKYANLVDYQRLPLESSISSLKAAALPRYLLVMAVLLFVVGIGIYELFRWKPWAMVPDLGHRNVFIVFILAVGLYLTYDLVIAVARINDQDKRDKEFNTDSLGGYRRPKELRELEKRLEKVRKRVGLTAKMEDLESRFQADITELRDFKADQQRLGRDLQQNQTEIAQHKANIQQTMQDNDEWMARAKARREARLKAIDDETEARRQQQTLQHEQEGLGDDANVRPGSQHHK